MEIKSDLKQDYIFHSHKGQKLVPKICITLKKPVINFHWNIDITNLLEWSAYPLTCLEKKVEE